MTNLFQDFDISRLINPYMITEILITSYFTKKERYINCSSKREAYAKARTSFGRTILICTCDGGGGSSHRKSVVLILSRLRIVVQTGSLPPTVAPSECEISP